MAKERSWIRNLVEYAGLLAGYVLLAWPPLALSAGIARAAGDIWRLIDKRHRKLAVDQSMDRLGIDEAAAERLVRDNYRHYALAIMEVARLRRLSPAEALRRTNVNGFDEVMQGALAHGKGLVLVTGHVGNWEWGAVVGGMLGDVDGLIARPLDNPHIDRFIREIRERTGATVWDKLGSMRRALAALRSGKAIVAVVDQDGGRKGTPAPFLGKDSSTMSGPVDLAIRTGSPLFVGAMMRDPGPGRFTMVSKRVHWPDPAADPGAERSRLAAEINADLSEIIRAYPEQWIWIHRRWKTVLPKNDS